MRYLNYSFKKTPKKIRLERLKLALRYIKFHPDITTKMIEEELDISTPTAIALLAETTASNMAQYEPETNAAMFWEEIHVYNKLVSAEFKFHFNNVKNEGYFSYPR